MEFTALCVGWQAGRPPRPHLEPELQWHRVPMPLPLLHSCGGGGGEGVAAVEPLTMVHAWPGRHSAMPSPPDDGHQTAGGCSQHWVAAGPGQAMHLHAAATGHPGRADRAPASLQTTHVRPAMHAVGAGAHGPGPLRGVWPPRPASWVAHHLRGTRLKWGTDFASLCFRLLWATEPMQCSMTGWHTHRFGGGIIQGCQAGMVMPSGAQAPSYHPASQGAGVPGRRALDAAELPSRAWMGRWAPGRRRRDEEGSGPAWGWLMASQPAQSLRRHCTGWWCWGM